MWNWIALFTKSADTKTAGETAEKAGVYVVSAANAEELPPWTTAIITDGRHMSDAINGAIRIGNWSRDTLSLLAHALDCREGFPEGSSWRVMEHANRFADALNLSTKDRIILARAALLRDVGKVLIPNQVLLKDGVLNYEEWTLIQRHSHLGADLLAATNAFADIADVVRHHHESSDGDGYPLGIEGEAIPLLSRILKIIDVYCAMTSPRHYRVGHASHEEALHHLLAEQGKHFDGELVDVFIQQKVGQPWPSKGVNTPTA